MCSVGMIQSNRKKYESNIVTWMTILGVPLGVSIAIFTGMGFPWKTWLPVSILISFEVGLIAYLGFQHAKIKDLKKENSDLKRMNKKLKTKHNGKNKN